MPNTATVNELEFMERAHLFATAGSTILEASLQEGMSLQGYKNLLLEIAIKHQKKLPSFPKKRERTHLEFIETVRRTGRHGKGKRIILPPAIFQAMNWQKGDRIRIRISGKKIFLESENPKPIP